MWLRLYWEKVKIREREFYTGGEKERGDDEDEEGGVHGYCC